MLKMLRRFKLNATKIILGLTFLLLTENLSILELLEEMKSYLKDLEKKSWKKLCEGATSTRKLKRKILLYFILQEKFSRGKQSQLQFSHNAPSHGKFFLCFPAGAGNLFSSLHGLLSARELLNFPRMKLGGCWISISETEVFCKFQKALPSLPLK